jgi:hypothetical protein
MCLLLNINKIPIEDYNKSLSGLLKQWGFDKKILKEKGYLFLRGQFNSSDAFGPQKIETTAELIHKEMIKKKLSSHPYEEYFEKNELQLNETAIFQVIREHETNNILRGDPDQIVKSFKKMVQYHIHLYEPEIIEKVLKNENISVRQAANHCLINLYKGQNRSSIFKMGLEDPELSIAQYTAENLELLNEDERELRESIYKIALNHDDETVRSRAISYISSIKTIDFSRIFKKAMEDSNDKVRQSSARALKGYNGLYFPELFKKAMGDSNDEVRQSAASALEGYNGVDFPELFKKAMEDSNNKVRQSAASALEGYEGVNFPELFKKAMEDKHFGVRYWGILSLTDFSVGGTKNLKGVELDDLKIFLHDEDRMVQSVALHVLTPYIENEDNRAKASDKNSPVPQ